jgi:8-oxo-dGTP pyrophosphatase MutT (NUDIX family)
MENDVHRYLAEYQAHYETVESWPIQGKLRVRLNLAKTLPPAGVSSSILSIVLNRDREVLFLYPTEVTGSIAHLLIGGRPQAGESPEDTVIREVAEETGWLIKPARMIGFRHFFHLEPRSSESDRPYPDFIQPIYAVSAEDYVPESIIARDHIPAEFVAYDVAEKLIELAQRPLLKAAKDTLDLRR